MYLPGAHAFSSAQNHRPNEIVLRKKRAQKTQRTEHPFRGLWWIWSLLPAATPPPKQTTSNLSAAVAGIVTELYSTQRTKNRTTSTEHAQQVISRDIDQRADRYYFASALSGCVHHLLGLAYLRGLFAICKQALYSKSNPRIYFYTSPSPFSLSQEGCHQPVCWCS